MDVRTYRVKELREALRLIRRELGPEAALLHTRRVRRRGWGGWLTGATELEVVAGMDAEVPYRLPTEWIEEVAGPADRKPASRPGTASQPVGETELSAESQVARKTELRAGAMLSETRASRRLPTSFAGPFGWNPGRSHWVALVGPTGVGKTTTLAKLAAEYRIHRRLEVGLVTLDTYRVNGAAHLKTYAEILGLPLEVVDSVERMREVADELTERFDLVLLDTGGQGPRDTEQRRRLDEMLEVARPDEVHLTLSATTAEEVWRDALRGFASLNPTSMIVTKLDEATSRSAQLTESIIETGLPLSYLTFGQRVPQDMVAADTESVSRWLGDSAMRSEDPLPRAASGRVAA